MTKSFIKGLLLPLNESLKTASFADAWDIISIAEGIFYCICEYQKKFDFSLTIKLNGGEECSIYEVYTLLSKRSIQPRFLQGVAKQLEDKLLVYLEPHINTILK